jgi:hypothetical protein
MAKATMTKPITAMRSDRLTFANDSIQWSEMAVDEA